MQKMIENNTNSKSLKIGILGDSKVGKTDIRNAFFGFEFNSSLVTTGIDKIKKNIKLDNGQEIKINFWDTPGTERHREIVLKSLRDVQGIALVFDIAHEDSLDYINSLLEEKKKNFPNQSLVLLGNKIDIKKRVESNPRRNR